MPSGHRGSGRRDPHPRDPHPRDPHSRDSQSRDPYLRNDYQHDAYELEPYQRDAYQLEPYQREPYQPDHYQRDAYRPDPYQRDAYQQDSYQGDSYQGGYQRDSYQGDAYLYEPHPHDQAAGLQHLMDMAGPDGHGYGDGNGYGDYRPHERDAYYEPHRPERDRGHGRGVRGHNGALHNPRQELLAAREVTPGALRDQYDIPEITFHRREARGLFLTSIVVAAWISYHLGWASLALLACAAPGAALRATSYVLSWFDRPTKASPEGMRKLDRLHVAIAVPVYNEDAGLLDRAIYAMMNQSRPPELIWIVDDGSKTDYSTLVDYWVGTWSNGTEIRWTRQHNQGKRRAHAYVFERVPEADIFITIDSDTTIEYRAIEEGLKPFQDPKVQSVAGIEMGFNAYENFLTRIQNSLQLFSQAVVGASWSVIGDMFTNRGPYALYRATLIRKYSAVYRDEVFFGRRVILGDDSLLALCASTEGKSVQQLTAIGLTMWPEQMGHHLRQRLRWARGRAVRNFWRIKYRPITSYCWWLAATGIQAFLTGIGLFVVLVMTWPLGEPVLVRAGIALCILSVVNGLRTLCYRRSDEPFSERLILVLIRPISAAWSGIMLARVLRTWGTLTLLKQGWTTRQKGAELVFSPTGPGEAAPEAVPSGTAAA